MCEINNRSYTVGQPQKEPHLHDHLFNDERDIIKYIEGEPDFREGEVEQLLEDEYSDESFNDDAIPDSEKELFSSSWDEEDVGEYLPPMTRAKKYVLCVVMNNVIETDDDDCVEDRKMDARDDALRYYTNSILKKRAVKAYKRIKSLEEQGITDPEQASFFLEKLELDHKQLNRGYYHEPLEPPTYKKLLKKRKKAIRRKYELYALDPEYRKEVHDRAFACIKNRQCEGVEEARLAKQRAEGQRVLDGRRTYGPSLSIHDSDWASCPFPTFGSKEIKCQQAAAPMYGTFDVPAGAAGRTQNGTFTKPAGAARRAQQGTFSILAAEAEESQDDTSSFYDTQIPESEREYFGSSYEEDDIPPAPPKSRRLYKYGRLLDRCEELEHDSPETLKKKLVKKADVIAQFLDFIDRNRAVKALARLKTVQVMQLAPEYEADHLTEMETKDKKLHRPYYYAEDEPESNKELLQRRRYAIMEKYERYATDPVFRQAMKDKAYVDFIKSKPSPLFEDLGVCEAQSSESSFNDTEIPTSEEEFMSSPEIKLPKNFLKPITRSKKALYRSLEKYEPCVEDTEEILSKKIRGRLSTIKNYKDKLIERRRMKAINRLDRIKKMCVNDPGIRANILEEMELLDKKLEGDYYYLPVEPEAFVDLLNKRQRAIHRKYEAYVRDEDFRQKMEDRIRRQAYERPKQNSIKLEFEKTIVLRIIEILDYT